MELLARILRNLHTSRDRVVFADPTDEWTGSDALASIAAWSDGIRRLELRRGDVLGLSLPSSPDLAFALVAAWSRGLDVALFNPYLGSLDLEAHVGAVQPARLVLDETSAVGWSRNLGPEYLGRSEVVTAGRGTDVTSEHAGSEIIGFTSGTSGMPKAVRHLVPRITRMLESYNAALQLTQRDAFICVLPTYLVAACIPSAVYGMWLGAPLIMLPKFHADAYLELVRKHAATYCMAVPAVYRELLHATGFDAAAVDSVTWPLCGAAPLDDTTRAAWAEATGGSLVTCSGSTEAGGYISIDWTRSAPPGSAGTPLPHCGLQILDESGASAAAGQVGELGLDSGAIFGGYVSTSDGGDKVFRTGDLGYLDAGGYLHYVDRASSVINRGGFKVHAAEVERALAGLEGVEVCAVVRKPDARLGEVPVAFIESARSITTDEVRAYLRGKLAAYKIPVETHSVGLGALPRSAYGKLARAKLTETAARGEAVATGERSVE